MWSKNWHFVVKNAKIWSNFAIIGKNCPFFCLFLAKFFGLPIQFRSKNRSKNLRSFVPLFIKYPAGNFVCSCSRCERENELRQLDLQLAQLKESNTTQNSSIYDNDVAMDDDDDDYKSDWNIGRYISFIQHKTVGMLLPYLLPCVDASNWK